MSSSWYSKIESRWASRIPDDATRRPDDATGGVDRQALELRRVSTAAERVISAPRSAVWATANADDEADAGWHQQIVGAPASGVGARHLHVLPPLPPFGMRSVTYTEVTAFQEGYWYTTQTLAGTWEHTETLLLQDTSDVRLSLGSPAGGQSLRPGPRTSPRFRPTSTDLLPSSWTVMPIASSAVQHRHHPPDRPEMSTPGPIGSCVRGAGRCVVVRDHQHRQPHKSPIHPLSQSGRWSVAALLGL